MPICENCGGKGFTESYGLKDVGNEDCPNCLGHDPARCPQCTELLDWSEKKERYYCTKCGWKEK